MAFEQTEYRFPDEDDDSDIEIEIEDDTPEEDRGRKPMPKHIVDELEEDELDSYDEKAQQRLKQMRKSIMMSVERKKRLNVSIERLLR